MQTVKYKAFELNNPLSDVIVVDHKKFKVCSIIFHQGESILSGHFINLLRYNNSWVRTSDEQNIGTELWPTYGQPYLIFLERIFEGENETNKVVENQVLFIRSSGNKNVPSI